MPAVVLVLAGCHQCGSEGAGAAGVSSAVPALSVAPGYDPDWVKPPRPDAGPNAVEGTDPLRGEFSLADATADLPADGTLVATITTAQGDIRCHLWPDRAPRTVANFVGLANGLRPFKAAQGWLETPAYDGSSFYRVIRGVGVLAGRIRGAARDSPGYWLADEMWPGMQHDRAGLLCARGVGPDRVGSEFLITSAPAPALDAPSDGPRRRPAFTVFGACAPLALIERIAEGGDAHGRPREHVIIERIRVERVDEPDAGTEPATSTAGRASSSAKPPKNRR
jgi:peptidyl-prolyl cis-trans isomerase A (cyclophilin A)